MIIGIDASNLRSGGGVTHLVELLRASDPVQHGFERIIVWSGADTLDRIENRPWIMKRYAGVMEKSIFHRAHWQRTRLSGTARDNACDILFVPGGSFAGDFHPTVTMSRNLLPFEWKELRRYGLSLMTLKLMLLRWTQSQSVRRADGMIFLTRYAEKTVMNVVRKTNAIKKVIPHGVDSRFFRLPRQHLDISQYTFDNPFRILYVSIIDMYKHQWNVAKAVACLRNKGVPIELELVGPIYPPAMKKLRNIQNDIDPEETYIKFSGSVPHGELHLRYQQANLCVYASSCENLPNILLEGMASGLPIACSMCGPMPEVLDNAGLYFDPENPNDIARVLEIFINSKETREALAGQAFKRAHFYSWNRCAKETFDFLRQIVN